MRVSDRQHPPAGDDAGAELARGLCGEVLQPGQPEYESARRVWNGTIDRYPALIARCADTRDVVRAVEYARGHRLPAAIRGGAHNVGGTAVCDGGVVIDLSRFKAIEVDPVARIARVGGGVTWGELDRATQAHGLACPGGVVSTTGVAGLTLGGGIGWLRRRHGLSCDNLLAAELVTADGRLRRVDVEHEPELFWGLRGGGGNFGVVTAFEFRLHPVGPEVYFAGTFYPARMLGEALRFYREYTSDLPEEVSSFAIAGNVPDDPGFPESARGQPCILLAGCHAGPPDEGERVLAPLRGLGEPLVDISDAMAFVDIQQLLDDDYPEGRLYYWKSLYMDELSDPAIDDFADLAAERPSALTTIDIWHLGGAISRQPPEATAAGNRDARYLLGVESNWDDPGVTAANVRWTRRACERMAPHAAGGSYLNFEPAGEVTAASAHAERYPRLQRLKAAVDPDNLFRINHNIEPHAGT